MRGTKQERAEAIARTFIDSGMSYAAVGRKHGRLFSRGGKPSNEDSIATNTGKTIVESRGVQAVLERIVPKEGIETKKYVREKLHKWAEYEKNPHVSLKALDLMGRTEAMYTDKVQMDATTRNMDVYVDYTGQENSTMKPKS